MRGVAAVKPGNTTGHIGAAIQTFAERERCSVVRDFCGHGLGRVFHDRPNILHYGEPGDGVVLEPGMLFTIEPMINLGKPHVKILPDGWTAVTRDRELSAQFEHTVGVTETGCEVFTISPGGLHQPPYQSRPESGAAGERDERGTEGPRRRAPSRARCFKDADQHAGPSPAPEGPLRQRRAGGAARLRAARAGAVQRHSPPRHQAARQAAARALRLVRRGGQRAARAAEGGRRASATPPSCS